jgi:hypothetical protein
MGLTGRNKEADKHHKNGRAKGEIGLKMTYGDPNERSNDGNHTKRKENQQERLGSGKKIKEHEKKGMKFLRELPCVPAPSTEGTPIEAVKKQRDKRANGLSDSKKRESKE